MCVREVSTNHHAHALRALIMSSVNTHFVVRGGRTSTG